MQKIILGKSEHIGVITLNSPETYNVLNQQLAREAHQALQSMEDDPEIRVIIIKGAGKSLCAGVDIKEFMSLDPPGQHQLFCQVENFISYITRIGKPVIVAAHGNCVAAGTGLVATCDLAIAAEDARFGATAINVGLFCAGPSAPLSRSIGRKKVLELLFTGEMIDAYEAERIGLVNKVVPNGDLDKAVLELAHKLASKSPTAIQLGKRAFYQQVDMHSSAAVDYLIDVLSIIGSFEDASEGIEAFLEKREPHWKGK